MLLHRLAKALVVATLVLVGWGGTVTSTNSGLACGDHWPACFEVRRAQAGEAVRPTLMPRMEGGVLIEHGHRALATLIGMGAIGLVLLALRQRPIDRGLRRAAYASLALVVTQGLLGALTVRMRLPAAVTTLHLSFSMAFAGSLVLVAFRSRPGLAAATPSVRVARGWSLATVLLVFTQLLLGAVVRHTGSAPVCTAQFPLCNGAWLPVTTEQWIHTVHRLVACAVLGVVIVSSLGARARATRLGRPFARTLATGGLVLVVAQVTLGIVTVLTGIRPLWATLHLVGGALLWLDVLATHLALGPLGVPRARQVAPVEAPDGVPQGAHA